VVAWPHIPGIARPNGSGTWETFGKNRPQTTVTEHSVESSDSAESCGTVAVEMLEMSNLQSSNPSVSAMKALSDISEHCSVTLDDGN
jgi:hypothetical protein